MVNRAALRSLVPVLAITAVLALAVFAPSRNFPFNGLLVGCNSYGYVASTPTVSGVTPNQGTTGGGTTVSITGSGFCNTTSAVNFGATAAASFKVQSDTLISAVTPAHAAGAVDVTVTTAGGTSATSAADKFTFAATGAAMWACSNGQYWLTGNDGATWVVIDGTYLSITFYVPTADSYAIIGGNADLWTQTAGVNQDLGIQVIGSGFPTTQGQPEAWKESGGSGGTFSPNAAFVQTVVPVKFDNTYTAKLLWKANVANSGTIYAGAGPAGGKYSSTCITVRLVLQSAASVVSKVSTSQYTLTGNNGSAWQDMDATNLSLSYTPAANGFLVATGNADLWTNTAGYNQDIAVNVNGGVSAWKESGGFAGTFSPNAAFVQSVFSVTSGTAYATKLQWKTNVADPNTIYAGAGPIAGKFSPTSLTVLFLPTGGNGAPMDKASTLQYQLTGNDGGNWVPVDLSKFVINFTPTNSCDAVLSGNVDLWTSSAGYNQDVGIFVSDTGLPTVYGQPEAWKESGGFNGTFSPNAAFVQVVVPLKAGTAYSIILVWKANKPDPGTIWAGAGPISGAYSPTRLTLQPVGC